MPRDVVPVRGLGRESVSGLRQDLRRDSDSTAAINSLPTSPVSCSNKYPFDRCAPLDKPNEERRINLMVRRGEGAGGKRNGAGFLDQFALAASKIRSTFLAVASHDFSITKHALGYPVLDGGNPTRRSKSLNLGSERSGSQIGFTLR